ncbi:MAG: hypothetical protein J1F12_05355 [Muribaculaceae bacterium]|nr:hypothetical protein [Muribaculaceae bacterium]
MKKIFLSILFIITLILPASAKGEDGTRREKMMREVMEFKMKYLAQEMQLSELQKKKFYELYEEMCESKKDCYQEAVVMDRKLKEEKNPSEEEYQQVRNAFNTANANWAATQKEYDEKFSEFLTQKQIYKMQEAESSFRGKFEEMKHKRKKDHHKGNQVKIGEK